MEEGEDCVFHYAKRSFLDQIGFNNFSVQLSILLFLLYFYFFTFSL